MVISLLMVHILLLQSGDVHPNPRPSSVSSDTSDNFSPSFRFCKFFSSFIVCSSQCTDYCSITTVDMILVEMFNFDVVVFAKTWLNPNKASDDIS